MEGWAEMKEDFDEFHGRVTDEQIGNHLWEYSTDLWEDICLDLWQSLQPSVVGDDE